MVGFPNNHCFFSGKNDLILGGFGGTTIKKNTLYSDDPFLYIPDFPQDTPKESTGETPPFASGIIDVPEVQIPQDGLLPIFFPVSFLYPLGIYHNEIIRISSAGDRHQSAPTPEC